MNTHNWEGTEFKPKEVALDYWENQVVVQYWSKPYGGWWYVQLPNGGMHYTRLLSKIQ